MWVVSIKFEVIDLCNKKNSLVINSKYFNDNFDNNLYVVAINNLLLQISCSNKLLLHKFYCNISKIIDKNNSD